LPCIYLLEFLKLGADNNPVEVEKLQRFLKNFEGFENLEVTGIFNQATFDAVSLFQEKYSAEILDPWGFNSPTGYVYLTTKKKVNEIFCNTGFPLSSEQEAEIIAFRNYLQSLVETGAPLPTSPEIGETSEEEILAGTNAEEQGAETGTNLTEEERSFIANQLAAIGGAIRDNSTAAIIILLILIAIVIWLIISRKKKIQ